MDNTKDPLECIKDWQTWYRKNRIIAEMDTPLVTKDSRENLHDTPQTVDTLCNVIEAEAIKKATTCFADTIAEYSSELSGAELYRCFYAAAVDNFNHADKEYKKAKQLMDMLRLKKDEN